MTIVHTYVLVMCLLCAHHCSPLLICKKVCKWCIYLLFFSLLAWPSSPQNHTKPACECEATHPGHRSPPIVSAPVVTPLQLWEYCRPTGKLNSWYFQGAILLGMGSRVISYELANFVLRLYKLCFKRRCVSSSVYRAGMACIQISNWQIKACNWWHRCIWRTWNATISYLWATFSATFYRYFPWL